MPLRSPAETSPPVPFRIYQLYHSRPIVLAHIFCGLGNQLFQYAAALELSHRLGVEMRFNLSYFSEAGARPYLLPELGLQLIAATSDECSAPAREPSPVRKMVARVGLAPRPWQGVLQIGGDLPFAALRSAHAPVELKGYWQGEAFFPTVGTKLADQLMACTTAVADAALAAELRRPGTVALHVRRGDYVAASRTSPFYRLLEPAYYHSALDRLNQRGPVHAAVIFTDEPTWCSENLRLGVPTTIVARDRPDASAATDLVLMAQAGALVIANSTFSWWAAWIATQRGAARVVAPAAWFDDPDFAAWTQALRVPGWEEL